MTSRRGFELPVRVKGLVALTIAALVAVTGAGQAGEERLRLLRDSLHQRAASGRIAIVEIDAQSLHAVGQWPWSRRIHAELLDRLRALQVSTVAYDVDFSARSTPGDDAAFASALRRADGNTILPTFRQAGSNARGSMVENLPIAPFREHAMLASVNITTEADGQLRHYDYGTITAGVPRPSVAAMLAGASGKMGTTFRIDPTIEPATIPRISAIDVIQNRFDPAALRGKSVLIGATAIEMGDRYPLPGHGVLPGVVAQALAAETLIAGTGGTGFGPLPPLLAAIMLTLLYASIRRAPLATRAVGAGAVVGAALLLETLRLPTIEIVPALTLLGVEWTWTALAGFLSSLKAERSTDRESGLPNQRALEASAATQTEIAVVAMRMLRFEEMESVLDTATRARLTARIVDRLELGFPDSVFHVVAPGVMAWSDDGGDALTLSDRIEGTAALFRTPLNVGGRTMLVTPNFGICVGEGRDAARLIAQAGLAARHAAESGKSWAIHSDAAATSAERMLMLLADLDTAIDDGQIHVVFQPKWSVVHERVSGAEALVRWQHPTLGAISPDDFIPLLESTGNIARLTLSVVDRCVEQLHEWHAIGCDLGLAVNVSAMLLDDKRFVADLDARLGAATAVRSRLTLEITESAAIATAESAIAALVAIRALGVRISIDDYGTGHATLGYLKSFPTDEIKIDKSFVTSMLGSVSDQILVRSTIELARELGFSVVAEGVEDKETLAKLSDYGCDTAQGWVIGKPADPTTFAERWITPPLPARRAA